MELASSWILVGFTSAEPQWDPHFRDEKAEALRIWVSCPRSPRRKVSEPRSRPGPPLGEASLQMFTNAGSKLELLLQIPALPLTSHLVLGKSLKRGREAGYQARWGRGELGHPEHPPPPTRAEAGWAPSPQSPDGRVEVRWSEGPGQPWPIGESIFLISSIIKMVLDKPRVSS